MSNEFGKFDKTENVNLKEVAGVYQRAFAGELWYEASKCAKGEDMNCENYVDGGFCRLPNGAICDEKELQLAYPTEELIESFKKKEQLNALWYRERDELGRLAMASLFWMTNAGELATKKYSDVPAMSEWLSYRPELAGGFTYLDEVFADKNVRSKGNLDNFGEMIRGAAGQLESPVIAYRTINEKMTDVAKRDFKDESTLYVRQEGVPDRRDFVVINLNSFNK